MKGHHHTSLSKVWGSFIDREKITKKLPIWLWGQNSSNRQLLRMHCSIYKINDSFKSAFNSTSNTLYAQFTLLEYQMSNITITTWWTSVNFNRFSSPGWIYLTTRLSELCSLFLYLHVYVSSTVGTTSSCSNILEDDGTYLTCSKHHWMSCTSWWSLWQACCNTSSSPLTGYKKKKNRLLVSYYKNWTYKFLTTTKNLLKK